MKYLAVRRVGLGVAVLVGAGLATEAVFWITGRGGAVPCGEDSWRWGLMQALLGAPMLLLGFVAGLASFAVLRARLPLALLMASIVCAQLLTALALLAILQWPDVIYRPPSCE